MLRKTDREMSTKKPVSLCDPYVWEDPRYLFRTTWLDRYSRKRDVCHSELINEIIFIYTFAILGGAFFGVLTGFGSAPLFAAVLATFWLLPTFLKVRVVENFRIEFAGAETLASQVNEDEKLIKGKPKAEGFQGCPLTTTRDRRGDVSGLAAAAKTEGFVEKPIGGKFNDTGVPGNDSSLAFQNETLPCVKNPFHNVLLDELPTNKKMAANRSAAPDIRTTESKIKLDDFFRVQWYSDPTDVFGKAQSQREFVTQPATTIPNDQESYQNWLYKIPGKTCKEGGYKNCYGGANGGVLPWANL